MGFSTKGTQITEFSKKTGPQGKALQGDGERGLGSHTEATRSVKDRVSSPAGSTVGFQDTPEVTAAFDKLSQARRGQEAEERRVRGEAGKAAASAAAAVQKESVPALAAGSVEIDRAARQLGVARARQELDRAEAAAKPPGPTAGAAGTTTAAPDKGKKPAKVDGKTKGDA